MSAYYNELDPFAAQWLRNLIAAGQIAPGDVDERSIHDVRATDLDGYTQCHFFAGIGGWSYALRLAGWPDDRPVWTGSCPCQPFSVAGLGRGAADARHLWPEWFRLVRECRPSVIFGEQVAGKAGRAWLDIVSADLASCDYAFGAADLPAACVGAPHIRQRLWFVADAPGERQRGRQPRGMERTEHQKESRQSESRGAPQTAGHGSPTDRLANAERAGCETRQPVASRNETRPESALQPGARTGPVADAERGAAERHRHDMAAAAAGGPGTAPEQRVRADAGHGGATGVVVNPERAGLQGHAGHGGNGRQPGRFDAAPAGPASETGATGPVADAEWQQCSREYGQQQADRRANPWADLVWLPCRDGQARPTQPGVQPLAHGVPARVGRLRAYGNAIVPQVATEFVRAFMDSRQHDDRART